MLTNPGVMETIDTGFLVQTGQIIPVRLWKQAYARKALLSRSVRRSMRSWEREDRAERLRRRAEQDYVHDGGKYGGGGGGGRGAFGDFGNSAAARHRARRGNDVATSSVGQLSAQASSSAAEAALASSGRSAAGQAEAHIMDQQRARQAAAAQAAADEAAAAEAEWSASDLAPLAKLDRLVGAARAREAEVLEHPERANIDNDACARPGLAALGISMRSFLPPSSPPAAAAEDGCSGARRSGGAGGGGNGGGNGSGGGGGGAMDHNIVHSSAAKREWVALYTGSKRTGSKEQEAAARAGGGAAPHGSAIAKANKRNICYHGKHNDASAQAAFLESFCGISSRAQRRTRYDAKLETDAIIAQTQERIALLFAHPPTSAFMDTEPGEKRAIL